MYQLFHQFFHITLIPRLQTTRITNLAKPRGLPWSLHQVLAKIPTIIPFLQVWLSLASYTIKSSFLKLGITQALWEGQKTYYLFFCLLARTLSVTRYYLRYCDVCFLKNEMSLPCLYDVEELMKSHFFHSVCLSLQMTGQQNGIAALCPWTLNWPLKKST